MAVYGDMLSFFPELMETYEVFNMDPRIGGGYGERYGKRSVRGYWSWRKSSKAGVEDGNRTANDQATFWVKDDFFTRKPVINQFDYVAVDGRVFEVIEDDNFSREGGFTRCLMQLVAAVTDQQHTNMAVDEVIREDYA